MQKQGSCSKLGGMTKPLALVCYENLLPGSQLVNRLQDLDYRVQVVTEPDHLRRVAEAERALVVLVEWDSNKADMVEVLRVFREGEATRHIPVIVFSGVRDKQRAAAGQAAAQTAGATLVASDAAILGQLPQLLQQALAFD